LFKSDFLYFTTQCGYILKSTIPENFHAKFLQNSVYQKLSKPADFLDQLLKKIKGVRFSSYDVVRSTKHRDEIPARSRSTSTRHLIRQNIKNSRLSTYVYGIWY